MKRSISTTGINIILVFVILVALNVLGSKIYKRFDLTADHRYTLSEVTKRIVSNIDQPMSILVYLEGDFPAEFNRIQSETRQHLEELAALNDQIRFRFVNPKTKVKELVEAGLKPSRLTVQEDGQVSEKIIFPWALINYKGKTEKVSLLGNTNAASQEAQLQNAIENLEYAFTDAFSKITTEKNKKIAVLKGNGELDDIYLVSALRKLKDYYHLAPFTLDSVKHSPEKTLKQLLGFDLVFIAKPTERFTEAEKFTLDQYVVNGGKTLWSIDNIYADMDSLMTDGKMLAFNRDLNLTDLLFQYGVRINYNVTKDLYSATIRLATGNVGNKTQYQDLPWLYYPLVQMHNDNPVSTHIDPVLLKFPSTMDTLKNTARKTVILQSSGFARPIGTPVEIALEEISKKPTKEYLNRKNLIFGVLLEGPFTSAYASRVKPFDTPLLKTKIDNNRMAVISDGDVFANEVFRGEPLPIDTDKWTHMPYGNADLLLNTVNYLLDDSGILKLRSKKLQMRFLDKKKVVEERSFWQFINIVVPVLIVLLLGLLINFLRKRKYTVNM